MVSNKRTLPNLCQYTTFETISLKTGDMQAFQQTATQLAGKYNAQQFQRLYDGLSATMTLSNLPGQLVYPMYDQGTVDNTVPKGGGVLMYFSPAVTTESKAYADGPPGWVGGGPLKALPGEVAVLFSP